MSKEVLATVAGREITQEEFEAFLASVPERTAGYISIIRNLENIVWNN